jgi:predicted  nucleic acid-binding Zn-ribbon protein
MILENCTRCDELEAECERLRGRIEELEETLANADAECTMYNNRLVAARRAIYDAMAALEGR